MKVSEHEFKFEFHASVAEFMHKNVSMRFSFFAKVEETGQYLAREGVCNIEKPELKIEMIEQSNTTMKVMIKFPKVSGIDKFTKCSMEVDSPLVAATSVDLSDSEVNAGQTEKSFQIKTLKKPRQSILNVTLSSEEISSIEGSLSVHADANVAVCPM